MTREDRNKQQQSLNYQSLMYKATKSFHNRCIRTILGVTKYKQWKDRFTSKQLACDFGMKEPFEDLVMEYNLRQLGHLGRMGEERLQKRCCCLES